MIIPLSEMPTDLNKLKNKIIWGNCIEGMKKLPENCIDLICTDPPYNMKWSKPISLKNRKAFYEDVAEIEQWDAIDIKKLYQEIFPLFDRIIKQQGSILLFAKTEWITRAVDEAEKNGFEVKATITYHKTNPSPQVRKKNYLSACESIVWFTRKDAQFTFNFSRQNDMHNFIEMGICSGNERTSHPTQKPVKLMVHFIKIHSNEGDLICDPFLGSGTTAVACKRLQRDFIGFELSEEYCKIADEKIQKTKRYASVSKWL